MNSTGETLRHVTRELELIGFPFAVVGSIGASAWGLHRMTQDIDLIALAAVERAQGLLEGIVTEDIYVPLDDARWALEHGGSFNVINLESQDKVDIFVVKPDDAFASSCLERRVKRAIFGVDTWVTTAEDIVLAKLRWRLQSRSEQQWRDCVEVFAMNELDLGYMRKWADQLGLRDDLEDLIRAVSSIN